MSKLRLGMAIGIWICALGTSANARAEKSSNGLNPHELAEFNHLSEGSELYPYEWLLRLPSAGFKEANGLPSRMFQDLDQRFGLIQSGYQDGFMMPWQGLTTAWSDADPSKSEAKSETAPDQQVLVRHEPTADGTVASIRMVGINCALCHSSELKYGGRTYPIVGAPSLVNAVAFNSEIAKSILGVLSNEALMNGFLQSFQIQDAATIAKERSTAFGVAVKEAMGARKPIMPIVLSAMEALLRTTYRLDPSESIGTIRKRFGFLATNLANAMGPPKVKVTPAGFGRTDAFGVIGNALIRKEDPVDLTAPVHFPAIWAIRYGAFQHYGGSTNSVLMRNIGQSIGLGAQVLNEQGDSTVNLINVVRLEKLMYKIQVPNWRKIFGNAPGLQIHRKRLALGKRVYESKCMGCHVPQEKMGPGQRLRKFPIFSASTIGTDRNYLDNYTKPVNGKSFKDTLLDTIEVVKQRYFEKHQISPTTQAEWAEKSVRGDWSMRDPDQPIANLDGTPGHGFMTRHHSGFWALGRYLHNGSVPTIWDLLKPAAERPKVFRLKSHEYDPVYLGYAVDRSSTPCQPTELDCFDTSLPGNGNGGHEQGVNLSRTQKAALIEYLKVLEPLPEYSWK